MWHANRKKATIETQARLFMACWDVIASTEDELRFRLRKQTLTLHALNDVLERAAACDSKPGIQYVFDLSSACDMDSCFSVICALFVRFVSQVGQRCRITGLNPRLAEIMAFFFRKVSCVELEPC